MRMRSKQDMKMVGCVRRGGGGGGAVVGIVGGGVERRDTERKQYVLY